MRPTRYDKLKEIRLLANTLLTFTEWVSVEEVEGNIARIYQLADELVEEEYIYHEGSLPPGLSP